MVFSSVIFILAFLPIALLFHSVLLASTWKRPWGVWLSNLVLLGFNLLFYAWGEPRFIIILAVSIVINYLVALALSPTNGPLRHRPKTRMFALVIGLALNLAMLFFYKYMNLFVESGGWNLLHRLLPQFAQSDSFAKIALPLGISFYTFQGISYLIDVYRAHVPPTPSIVQFGCYHSLFPQLVAGPIVRYVDIEPQLTGRRFSVTEFSQGISRFIIGLAKKVLIADTLGRVADGAFNAPATELSPLAAWAGIICYTFQIYYDFSGYSDMAIGMGHMLGFKFLENFNYPYISRSIREFWRRWHISLSTWFRDYLYIPLGGSRCSATRTACNLLLVFTLCGIWHGASWIFLIWGLYHGIFLAGERLFQSVKIQFPRPVQHLYALATVMAGWVLFRCSDLQHAGQYFKALFGGYAMGVQANEVWLHLFGGDVYLALLIALIGSMPVRPLLNKKVDAWIDTTHPVVSTALDITRAVALLALFGICFLPLFGATYNAFIYFRF